MDVIRLISEGKSNKEIADSLFLAESTVKTHVSSILRKLNLKSRSEAVAYFYKENSASE
jgi:NarL family two-component system response regulator LiaR